MIQLPIEIGDTLLGGKFKNKRIVVKEIGLDEYGSPTVNGRSILKVRIPKLYKKLDENVMKSTKIEMSYNKAMKFANRGRQTKSKFHGYALDTDERRGTPNLSIAFYDEMSELPEKEAYKMMYDYYKKYDDETERRLKANPKLKIIGDRPNFTLLKSKMSEAVEQFQKLPITVKIKKQDKRFCLFLQTVDGEECLNPVGYETKELAQHAALTKGFTVDGYEPPTNVTKTPMLERLIREIISELDVDVEDAKIEAAINELSTLESKLAAAKAQIAALEKELGIDAMEKQYAKIVNEDLGGLLDEMKKDEVRIVRTKTVLMEIKRFQAERATYSHEKVLDFAMTQVNQDVKFKILQELKTTEKITKIKPSLSFSKRENVLREAGLIDRAVKWISTTVKNLVTQLRPKGQQIDANLDKLERVLKIK